MELRIIVDERTLRRMGRAKRRTQAVREDAAKKQRAAQLESDEALVARNLALQQEKASQASREDAQAAMMLSKAVELSQAESEAEVKAQAAIDEMRAKLAAERASQSKREAFLEAEMAAAIKKRLAADRARVKSGLSENVINRVAPASPKHKLRRGPVTPQTMAQPVRRALLTESPSLYESLRLSESLSRRGPTEEKGRRALRQRVTSEEDKGDPSVDALLGRLWTERAAAPAAA